MKVSVGILDLLNVRLTKNFNLVEPLLMVTLTWSSFSKVFRLNEKLHDAAGPVEKHNGKSPSYCYMIGQAPNACLLGHVT